MVHQGPGAQRAPFSPLRSLRLCVSPVFFDLNGNFCYDAVNFGVSPTAFFVFLDPELPFQNWGKRMRGDQLAGDGDHQDSKDQP